MYYDDPPYFYEFQSSPGPEAGCCTPPALRQSSQAGFNPHPARRPGAAPPATRRPRRRCRVSILTRPGGRVLPLRPSGDVDFATGVSILTRPGGRVLPPRPPRRNGTRRTRFNPHPARRPGAARPGPPLTAPRMNGVSILTRPGGRVLRVLLILEDRVARLVSILTRPGGRVLPLGRPAVKPGIRVSILTRPGGRVLPETRLLLGHLEQVSILTRPGGRVLHTSPPRPAAPRNHRFNPHPARRPGAARHLHVHDSNVSRSFNPHPARRPGAASSAWKVEIGEITKVSILTRPGGRVLPADCRRTGAQSRVVSILTRPGGRVLRRRPPVDEVPHAMVSILTRPGGRVLPRQRD